MMNEAEPLQHLMQILHEHHPLDEKERSDVALIAKLAENYPNLLHRDCHPGHVTGSALVIDPTQGSVLLHYHKRLKRWLQFGGHADGEQDPARVALREAQEESGLDQLAFFPENHRPRPLDIDVHRIPATPGEASHLHLDFRYVLVPGEDVTLRPAAGESRRFNWLSFEDVATMTGEIDAGLKRLVAKAANLCHPYASE